MRPLNKEPVRWQYSYHQELWLDFYIALSLFSIINAGLWYWFRGQPETPGAVTRRVAVDIDVDVDVDGRAFESLDEADQWSALLAELRPVGFSLARKSLFETDGRGLAAPFKAQPEELDALRRVLAMLTVVATDEGHRRMCVAMKDSASSPGTTLEGARRTYEQIVQVVIEALEERWSAPDGRVLADDLREALDWLSPRPRARLLDALGDRLEPADIVVLGHHLWADDAVALLELLIPRFGRSPVLPDALSVLLNTTGEAIVEPLAAAFEAHGTAANLAALSELPEALRSGARRRYAEAKKVIEERFNLVAGGMSLVDATTSAGGLSEPQCAAVGDLQLVETETAATTMESATGMFRPKAVAPAEAKTPVQAQLDAQVEGELTA